MTENVPCPNCGLPIAPNLPGGLCPGCLFRGVLDATTFGNNLRASELQDEFVPPTPEELAPCFPELEVLRFIGRGGMGLVYQARQPQLNRMVALKILLPKIAGDSAFADRFAREARLMALLNHPHVVAIYDFGQTEAKPISAGQSSTPWGQAPLYYFLMEYVDGLTLRQLLDADKLSPQQAVAIVPQICQALQFAHEKGIIHRDIKPENILLDRSGQVKIADFGLAKLSGLRPEEVTLSRTGQVLGTLHYMAPEQLERPLEVDHRADIYSLGVVFYQMLTGELPLGRFAPPSTKAIVDIRLDEVVLRALEKEPQRRYQQISALQSQVEAIASTPTRPFVGSVKRRSMTNLFASFVSQKWRASFWARIGIMMGALVFSSFLGILTLLGIQLVAYQAPARMSSNIETSPPALRAASTSRVIEAGLKKPDLPWPWQELERRNLTRADAENIVEGLIRWMESEFPEGMNQPLHWCDRLLEKLDREGLVGESLAARFQVALNGELRFSNGRQLRVRQGRSPGSFHLHWRDTWSHDGMFGMKMLNALRSVSLDGEPVDFQKNQHDSGSSDCWITFSSPQELINLSLGRHLLHVEADTAIVWSADLVGLDLHKGLASDDWPKPVKRWIRTSDLEIHVYGPDETIIQPIVDSKLDPMRYGFKPESIIVRTRGKKSEIVVMLDAKSQRLPVSVSFDVTLRIKEQQIKCGSYSLIELPSKEGFTRSGNMQPLNAVVDQLPEEITTADLVLTPNPSAIELDNRVDRYWGKEVIFKNVPLQRPNPRDGRPPRN